MDRKILIVALACLISSPMFAVVPIDSGVSGECSCVCEAEDDFSSGSCEGDCDCFVDCDGISCEADCVCLSDLGDDELDEDDELIFDEIAEDLEEIDDSGMMGVGEGTYADYEEVYVLDGETAVTNEVDITPSWCE